MNGDGWGASTHEGEDEDTRFSQGVANLLMAVEELRRACGSQSSSSSSTDSPVSPEDVLDWQFQLESILPLLQNLARWTDDYTANHQQQDLLQADMFFHCLEKATMTAQQTLKRVTSALVEPTDEVLAGEQVEDVTTTTTAAAKVPADQIRREAQAAVARITEINLLLLHQIQTLLALRPASSHTSLEAGRPWITAEHVIQIYVAFQRQTLRLRAKPAIAQLVQERQRKQQQQQHQQQRRSGSQVGHPRDQATPLLPVVPQQHAPVLTVILGQAASLIHPLLEWRLHLPTPADGTNGGIESQLGKMCQDSVKTLDEQAQSLTKTISDWFWEDQPLVEEWLQKSASMQQQHHAEEPGATLEQQQLGLLDSLVEEMAFACQVMARYQALLQVEDDIQLEKVIQRDLLPEWTWKYASLERFLAMQQWQTALRIAAPVHIVMGTAVHVPSVVEDAQYLSTRALQRSSSTRSFQAMGTVAYAISHDIWSTDMDTGVHHALLHQQGCWSDPDPDANAALNSSTSSRSGFASALLDALDQDLSGSTPATTANPSKGPTNRKPRSGAPSSGSFLSSLVGGGSNDKMLQMQLDTQCCFLNGIHAASGACRSLATFLDTLLSPPDEEGVAPETPMDEKECAMVRLAREELFRYEQSYQNLLIHQIQESLLSWCGGAPMDSPEALRRGLCWNELRILLIHETYALDAAQFAMAEADERLEREFMGPLRQARFLNQMSRKCENVVLERIGEVAASILTQLVLEVLWRPEEEKRFTDWGSLLFSKQIRLLQSFLAEACSPPAIDGAAKNNTKLGPVWLPAWEKLSQVITVLQLEKPADWLAYQSTSVLSWQELEKALALRVDFRPDAVQAVLNSLRSHERAGSTA